MKKQNCILKIFKNGECINFERFSCKRVNTTLNQYKKAFRPYQFNNYFFRDYRDADVIRIISTPDGYNEGVILAEYTPEEFFAAIS